MSSAADEIGSCVTTSGWAGSIVFRWFRAAIIPGGCVLKSCVFLTLTSFGLWGSSMPLL